MDSDTKRYLAIGLGFGAIGYVLSRRGSMDAVSRYSYGSPIPRMTANGPIDRDPAKLLPAFADRLELVFRDMRKLRWRPILWEGWRSRERAKMLAAKGTGIPDSMHFYGGAGDIVESKYLWSNPEFFGDLADVVRSHGLMTGMDFKRDDDKDPPHVQAVPGELEGRFKTFASDVERNNFLLRHYA